MSDVISVVPRQKPQEAFHFTGTQANAAELEEWAKKHNVLIQIRRLSEVYISERTGRKPELKIYHKGFNNDGKLLAGPAYLVVEGGKVAPYTEEEFSSKYELEGEGPEGGDTSDEDDSELDALLESRPDVDAEDTDDSEEK